MKNTLFFFFLLVLISCGKAKEDSGCNTMVCEAPAFNLSTTDSGPVPPEALQFDTSLTFVNFAATDQEKAQHAADLVKRVIQSQEFKDAVVGFTYNGEKKFVDNNGLTNLQIYDRIIIGAEELTPAHNYVLDARLQLYYEDSTTIGYTYESVNVIYMNTKYFNRYTPYQVAGNLSHEWLHKLGFVHDAAATPSRPYSVPYAVGYIIRDLAYDLFPSLY
jgi:hypothetical protein